METSSARQQRSQSIGTVPLPWEDETLWLPYPEDSWQPLIDSGAVPEEHVDASRFFVKRLRSLGIPVDRVYWGCYHPCTVNRPFLCITSSFAQEHGTEAFRAVLRQIAFYGDILPEIYINEDLCNPIS